MKRFVAIFLSVILMVSVCIPVLADDTIYVTLDGAYVNFDVKPQVVNGRTMVPIRAIFEAMGAVVEWDNSTGSAICTKDGTVVKMTVDSTDMYINGNLNSMDVSPVVIDGRTLAPARYVAEAFGANVWWDQSSSTVVITSGYQVEETVTLYAMDGRTLSVYKSQVPEYLKWGWYETLAETQTTLYAEDGRTLTVPKAQAGEYLKWGWYESFADTQATLYAEDGRTLTVPKSQVPEYLNLGWYRTFAETQATLYAADGRTITIAKSAVPSYKQYGWYESAYEASVAAQAASQAASSSSASGSSSSSYNPGADGGYYRTPKGSKYHLDPNCGGKNSYKTTNISGLSPCSKCAQ